MFIDDLKETMRKAKEIMKQPDIIFQYNGSSAEFFQACEKAGVKTSTRAGFPSIYDFMVIERFGKTFIGNYSTLERATIFDDIPLPECIVNIESPYDIMQRRLP